ncbi:MAG: hypothetical protein AB1644_04345 [Candidatus Zixiibacteriota bacterium]
MTGRPSPGQLHVVVTNERSSAYDPNTQTLYVSNAIDEAQGGPDDFDQDVIWHEYGHWIGDVFHFMDGGDSVHSWRDTVSLETAGTEAFAHLVAAWIKGSPFLQNRFRNFTKSFGRNVENGEWGFDGFVDSSANNWGAQVEAAVAGILWDIYDSQSDDHSTFGQMVYPHHADGIGDTLSDGIGDILVTLMDRNISGHHPDNIEEFWSAWFQQSAPLGHTQAMADIWYEHGINDEPCCIGTTGNVDYDPQDLVDISDLSYMVDFLFLDGPDPICRAEANVDADPGGSIDISDQSALIDFICFSIPLPSCP